MIELACDTLGMVGGRVFHGLCVIAVVAANESGFVKSALVVNVVLFFQATFLVVAGFLSQIPTGAPTSLDCRVARSKTSIGPITNTGVIGVVAAIMARLDQRPDAAIVGVIALVLASSLLFLAAPKTSAASSFAGFLGSGAGATAYGASTFTRGSVTSAGHFDGIGTCLGALQARNSRYGAGSHARIIGVSCVDSDVNNRKAKKGEK